MSRLRLWRALAGAVLLFACPGAPAVAADDDARAAKLKYKVEKGPGTDGR